MVSRTTSVLIAMAWTAAALAHFQPAPAKPPASIQVASPLDAAILEIRVKEGDRIEQGQVVALLDLRASRFDAGTARMKIQAAEADVRRAELVLRRTEIELSQSQFLSKSRIIPPETLQQHKVILGRCYQAIEGAKAVLDQAWMEYRHALLGFEQHKLRSPVRGTVRTVLKQRGDSVRALEDVVQIQIVADK